MEMFKQTNELKFLLPIMNKGHEIVMDFLELEVTHDDDALKAIDKLNLLKDTVLNFRDSLQDKKNISVEMVMNYLNEQSGTIIRFSHLNSIF